MPIHPTAIIDPIAQIDPTAEIGPYVNIGPDVSIGARTVVMANAFLTGVTAIGADNKIYPSAMIGMPPQHSAWQGAPTHTVIGDRNTFRELCQIHGSFAEGGKTVIGNDGYFMATSHVAHDCLIGNRVTIANCTLVAGHVEIEDQAFVSGLVGIHQFTRVGRLAMCAGMTRVHRDVPPFMMVFGDSEVIGLNRVGLRRAGFSRQTQAEIQRAYDVIYGVRHSLSASIRILKSETFGPEVQHLIEFLEKSKRGICNGMRTKGNPES